MKLPDASLKAVIRNTLSAFRFKSPMAIEQTLKSVGVEIDLAQIESVLLEQEAAGAVVMDSRACFRRA